MKLDLGEELDAFREEIRAWIQANRVDGLSNLSTRQNRGITLGVWAGGTPEQDEAYREWERRNVEAGLICPAWPEDLGSRGWNGVQLSIFTEELARAGVPRIRRGIGEWLAAPAIIGHGTEAQKAYFLPRIKSGQDIYCQGFSEPNHGSDLASVETKGVVDGDEIVITGSKIWTSGAELANTIFVLCRTDPEIPNHRGLSWVIMPFENNPVTVRPLVQMSGESDFGQEHFDGARAPLFNVIGGLNNGWKVAMTTMGSERGSETAVQHLRAAKNFWDLVEEAKKRGKDKDPAIRQKLAWCYSQVEVMHYAGLALLSRLAADKDVGPGPTASKLFSSEYNKKFYELAMEILGPDALLRPEGEGYLLTDVQGNFFTSRAATIFAGSSQIQRGIIGDRVLGLPR